MQTTQKHKTKLSCLLDLLEAGDDVMADKGFTLSKILSERDETLNIPPFLSSSAVLQEVRFVKQSKLQD
jgi:hypothetical protein